MANSEALVLSKALLFATVLHLELVLATAMPNLPDLPELWPDFSANEVAHARINTHDCTWRVQSASPHADRHGSAPCHVAVAAPIRKPWGKRQ
eukprot:scaffold94510_cov21-Tisochrysis_lutea.AAC.1